MAKVADFGKAAATKSAEQVEEQNVQVTNDAAEAVESETAKGKTYAEIVKGLISKGWKRRNALKVRNVNCTEKDNYTMVTFSVVPPIPGYILDEESGEYVLGVTNNIYSSSYAVSGAMKEDEEMSWLANSIVDKPKFINALFNGGEIDILSREIAAGEEYANPFGSAEPQVFDHDTIVNLIIGLRPGKNGVKTIESARAALAAQLFD